MKYLVAIPTLLFIFSNTFISCESTNNTTVTSLQQKEVIPLWNLERKFKDVWSWLQSQAYSEDTFIGRCFGGLKKLRLVINFIIFKLGVIVTAIAFLSALMFKSLGIGVLLLVISSVGLFSKLQLLKHGSHHSGSEQAVHLHIHNKGEHYSNHHFKESYPPWIDRAESFSPKNVLENEAIADLYKRIGLSENDIDTYS
ncbi:hypothetical protein FQR65_LT07863 [Abscondita terminalis]|nr:hypothetical protein FQR65_LT07863 [Abscondita terminalis]